MAHDVSEFQTQVIERSQAVPVLVDFWAAWCGPCRVLGPVLERLAAGAAGRWELAKVDTEAHPQVASRYGIMSIPAVKLFVDGQVVDEFVGALPEPEIRRWLARALPSPRAADVGRAASAIEHGDFEAAAAALREIVGEDPANLKARMLLARALLHLDPSAVAETVGPARDDLDLHDRAEALLTLAAVATWSESGERLPTGAARDRFLQGARALRAADFAAAFEAFIEALRAQRDYADGAAAAACRAMIIVLGIEHPIIERYFRAFSTVLHA